MIDKIWKLNEFLFVDIYTNWGSWDQFVFYGGRMLPDFSHEMCLTTVMLQIWQCFWGKDCLNCEHWILMIAGFAEELAAIPVLMVVENGCGQPMYWFWTRNLRACQHCTRCWPYSVGRNGSIALQELQCSYWSLLWWKHPKSLMLAQQFLNGSVYHCVCKYGPANIRSGALENEFAW